MRSLVLFLLLSSLHVCGQGYSAQQDSIAFLGHADSLVIKEGIQVQNVSGQFLDMAWQRVSQTLPAGWSASICDGVACRPPHVDFALYELDTTWNAFQNKIWMYYYPDGNPGSGTTTLELWDVSAQFDTLTLFFACEALLNVGIPETRQHTVLVYPNPAEDQLFVRSFGLDGAPWRVLNASGMIALDGRVSTGESRIDIRALPPGIYFLEIGKLRKRFVKS